MVQKMKQNTGIFIPMFTWTDTREEAEIEAIEKELDILSGKKRDLLEMQDGLNQTQHKTGKTACYKTLYFTVYIWGKMIAPLCYSLNGATVNMHLVRTDSDS